MINNISINRAHAKTAAIVPLLVLFLLIPVQIVVDNPLFMFERFVKGGGWLQIFILSLLGFVISYHMLDPAKAPRWRRRIWLIFSIWFFIQFALGLFVDNRFLMSGKLHLPVPFMIAAGPIYRWQFSIMTIIFLSTIVLSGPAWCSHFCYFGAWDSLAANGKTDRKPLKNKWLLKNTFLILVIGGAILFRMLGLKGLETLIPALILAIGGVGVILLISRRKGKMIHCTLFCPIGTLVSYLKNISPFRLVIEDSSCTNCMRCIPSCKYDALNRNDILNRKPGLTCTLCGDCVTSCKDSSIQYRLFKLSPEMSRRVFYVVVITLYILCLGLGRM